MEHQHHCYSTSQGARKYFYDTHPFVSISGSPERPCALDAAGGLRCWWLTDELDEPSGAFIAVAKPPAGGDQGCRANLCSVSWELSPVTR